MAHGATRHRMVASVLLSAGLLAALLLLARASPSAATPVPERPPKSASELRLERVDSRATDELANSTSIRSPLAHQHTSPFAQVTTSTVAATDIVLVFDESGSMDDGTYCYRDNSGNPCYIQGDNEYPEGERLYLPFDSEICATQVATTYDGYEILVSEAEYFDHSTSFAEHPYYRDYYEYPGTFWMLQRTQGSQASGYRYEQDDRRGAHLMHMPLDLTLSGHLAVTDQTPRLDYNFSIPVSGTWYAWIRAQCGAAVGNTTEADGCLVHWGVDGTWREGESTSFDDFGERGVFEAGSNDNRWIWVRLGAVPFTDTLDHQVNIWGGGMAFRLDKVLLTRNPEEPSDSALYPDRAPSFVRNTTPDWTDVQGDAYQTYLYEDRYGGPPDTGGRIGYACLPCNPFYGQVHNQGCTVGQVPGPGCTDHDGNGQIDPYEICDNRYDDTFDDEYPMRAAQEAAKGLLYRQQARIEQVGFVAYSTRYDQDAFRELMCNRWLDEFDPPIPDYPGVWDPTDGPDPAWTWCFDRRVGPDGYSQPERLDNTSYGSIIRAIEDMDAEGQTDVADGLREAIEAVGTSTGHYGRSCASKAIVLLLQGMANRWPGYPKCPSGSCCEYDLYLPNDGNEDEDKARDCAVYYADIAHQKSIVIYTVGLGAEADRSLLQEIADRTEGSYFVAPKDKDLEWAYQSIADQIVIDAPGIAASQHAGPIPVVPGKPLTYTLVVTNTGGVYLQPTVSETLPAHVSYDGPLSWTPIAAPGGVWTQTVAVTVEAGYVGSLTNTFVVTTQGCLAVTNTLVLKPDLAVSKHSSWPVRPGEQLTYTIAITNRGAFDLHATVTDVLPAHVTLVEEPLTWTPVVPAPGGVWTATVAVTVEEGYVGPLTNTVLASTEESVSGVYTHTLTPGIEASKVAHTDVTRAGEPLTYTLAVTNTGDFELALTITDVLPAHVTPNGPLTWTPILTEAGSVWQETVVVTVGHTYEPLSNVLQVANEQERMATCTETVTVEAWWLYLPLVVRLEP